MHALGLEFGSAARLSKRPGSVWNCLWGNALKRSPGIIRKSRVSYPGPGFLSSATWPLLPKKHYNGLNQTKPNKYSKLIIYINMLRNMYIYSVLLYMSLCNIPFLTSLKLMHGFASNFVLMFLGWTPTNFDKIGVLPIFLMGLWVILSNF